MISRGLGAALVVTAFLLATPIMLPSIAVVQSTLPSSVILTVYPDGSVMVSTNQTTTSLSQPGTVPNATIQIGLSTIGDQTNVIVNGTVSLPASLMTKAPYNYSDSLSVRGSYIDNISKGSIVIHAAPGIQSPLTTFALNYQGDSHSITATGNGTIQYGNYGSGLILNPTTIAGNLSSAEDHGLNASAFNKMLAGVPYGPFTVTSLALSATYGADSALVTGQFSMTGNMSALPFLLASAYALPFGNFTGTAQITANVVKCTPSAPASCEVTLQNTGTASTSVMACNLNINGTFYTGTVSPSGQSLPAGGSANVYCSAPSGVSSQTNYSVTGSFSLSDGGLVVFAGVFDPPMMSTTTTTMLPPPASYAADPYYKVYSTILSSFKDYSYSMGYSADASTHTGVVGFSITAHAAQNLNIGKAMKLASGLAVKNGAPETAGVFLNTTSVDLSNFNEEFSVVQNSSGWETIHSSATGLMIHPHVVMGSGGFNESALFSALTGGGGNLTLVEGSNQAGAVSIELPPGFRTPNATGTSSKTWFNANLTDFAAVNFKLSQATATATTVSTGSATTVTTTSPASTTAVVTATSGSMSYSTTSLVVVVGAVVAVVAIAGVYLLRRGPRIAA